VLLHVVGGNARAGADVVGHPWRLTSCARASKPPTAASCQRLNTNGMKERCKPGGVTGRNEAGDGARHDPGGEGAGGLTNYLNVVGQLSSCLSRWFSAQPQQSCHEGPFGQIEGWMLGSMATCKNRELRTKPNRLI
jgi:hypothetical protein